MRKFLELALSVSLLVSAVPTFTASAAGSAETISYTYSAGEGKTYTREMEKLDRGLVAVKSGSGVYLSWRLFDSEDARFGSAEKNVSFNVYRGNDKIAEVTDKTNYTDTTAGTSYSVAPVINGQEGERCEAVSVWNNNYIDIPLTKPAGETIYDPNGTKLYDASFSPADCSTGDLDGDGEYEIVVKWTSAEKDVGEPGNPAYSGTVHLAAYKLDGTKLWNNDIELGKNVYSSAHTVQFLVYDFNGDGKAEVMCQTSLGSKDAEGAYVSHSAKADSVVVSSNKKIAEFTDEENALADYRGDGRVITGEEFLTVFNGETGAAVDTIDLPTTRGNAKGVDYGDDFGNRSNRFVADVAYLDGEKPYAVYLRGYYFGRNGNQRTSIAGISFDGERLSPDYRFDTQSGQPGCFDGAYQYVGNGNHNCTVADVDNDGKDEFITGALCVEVNDENQFRPRWCTYLQHGDALHIGDYDPTHPGFEFFTVHEDNGTNTLSGKNITMDYGMSVIDADTGELLFHEAGSDDTGRGVMANIGMGGFYQIWSAKNGLYMSNGGTNYSGGSKAGLSQNFRVFWDGDLYDELLDGTNITSWGGNGMSRIFSASGCTRINGSKSNPGLQADLFGDWREEVVYPTTDGTKLRVFTTTTPTEYKIKTLMHDPVYRSGVAAEQTAYNQPPHVGMYMGEEMFDSDIESIKITSMPNKTIYTPGEAFDRDGMVVTAYYEDGTSKAVDAYVISGFDSANPGEQTVTVTFLNKTAELKITVKEISSITIAKEPTNIAIYQGGLLNTAGLVVKVVYNDGTSAEIKDYELEYDNTSLGSQLATVKYQNQTATFTINVLPASIGALDNTYATSSAESLLTTVPIGSYMNNFTIEHTVKINSMPANGNGDKSSTAGFFMRFMADLQDNPSKMHTGGGWYITDNGGKANIYWKSGARLNNATAIATGSAALTLGKEYTFRYEFTNVGTGSGAALKLSIIDEDGQTVAAVENLNMRNFSETNTGKTSPITKVEIHNQAKSGSTSNIVFENARVYSSGNITSVKGKEITVNLASASGMRVYAAKYDGDTLSQVQTLTPANAGETKFTADFEPDKVFLWADIMPIDFWSKNAE